jgi:hypothetical protein
MTLFPLFFLALLCTAPAGAEEAIFVEGEGFKVSQDLGGMPITREYCTSASGHQAADGIDIPGEWIRLPLTITTAGLYDLFVAYQANDGDTVQVRLTIPGSPNEREDIVSDFTLQGYGIG